MSKLRLLFTKQGRAVYLSHLDLMRTFSRAFSRAGIAIKNSEGFNPHPKISIALPLALGSASVCELLDFETVGEGGDLKEMCEKLAAALPEGIEPLRVYLAERKCSEAAWIDCELRLEYDRPTEDLAAKVLETLTKDSLVVRKKSKKGPVDFDMAPYMKNVSVERAPWGLTAALRVSAQEPTVNPELVAQALSPAPDFCQSTRLRLYDKNEEVFE